VDFAHRTILEITNLLPDQNFHSGHARGFKRRLNTDLEIRLLHSLQAAGVLTITSFMKAMQPCSVTTRSSRINKFIVRRLCRGVEQAALYEFVPFLQIDLIHQSLRPTKPVLRVIRLEFVKWISIPMRPVWQGVFRSLLRLAQAAAHRGSRCGPFWVNRRICRSEKRPRVACWVAIQRFPGCV
jgi:hypothetical protein